MTTSTLTQRHRAQQLLLRKATIADFERLWPSLDWRNLDETYPALAVRAAALVERNRKTSSGLALAYLRAFRRAEGLRDEVRPVVAQSLNVEQFGATLHATSVAAIKSAAARGVAADLAMTNGLTLASGAAARLVLDAGRQTTNATIAADARAIGWRRILGGGGCDFCRKLADRVYPRDNADFDAHGKCGCTSEPVYR